MSLMKKVAVTEVDVKDKDTLGGFQLFDTDVYGFTIKMAYVAESDKGALSFNLVAESDDGRQLRETIWFTNRKGETWFTNSKGETQNLPGFSLVESICMLTLQESLVDLETEDRVIKVYDGEAKAEINKTVEAYVDLIGQKIKLAVERQLQDKTKKEGDDYVATGETVERNVITKAFHYEKDVTLTEAVAKTEPVHLTKWVEKNKGKVIDKTSKDGNAPAKGAATSKTGSDPAAPKKKKDLFI